MHFHHHMKRATDPSPHVYGLSTKTASVAALTAAYEAASAKLTARGGAGRCRTASAKGAVKYLINDRSGGGGSRWLVVEQEVMRRRLRGWLLNTWCFCCAGERHTHPSAHPLRTSIPAAMLAPA